MQKGPRSCQQEKNTLWSPQRAAITCKMDVWKRKHLTRPLIELSFQVPFGEYWAGCQETEILSWINSCHSKCLWVCYLLESWFPTHSGVFSLPGFLNQEVSGDSVYICKELRGYCGHTKWQFLRFFNIVRYNGAILNIMSVRRYWVMLIEIMKNVFHLGSVWVLTFPWC